MLFTIFYENANTRVRVGYSLSEEFVCNVGVRQGENLSPLLFALYLNDFAKYMSQWYKGLQLFSKECSSQTSDDEIRM